MKKLPFAFGLLVVASASAWAETEKVTLSVSGMSCSACPLTIKKALSRIDGVEKAEVNYERKEAVVTYDDAKTNVDAITKVTTDIGYPSSVK